HTVGKKGSAATHAESHTRNLVWFHLRIRTQPLMGRPYVHLRRLGCHRLVVRHQGSKVVIAALKTRRRRAMKQFRSKHDVSLRGQPLAHIADVPVDAKCFLEQEYPRMRPTLLRTSYIGCHPGSVRNGQFHLFFHGCCLAHAASILISFLTSRTGRIVHPPCPMQCVAPAPLRTPARGIVPRPKLPVA